MEFPTHISMTFGNSVGRIEMRVSAVWISCKLTVSFVILDD